MPEAQAGETRQRIIEIAMDLIQTRGYSAFSYQDISDVLGIRKASIHYHFPAKSDLGRAAVAVYAERFQAHLDALMGREDLPTEAVISHYADPYRLVSAAPQRVCLCAALAAETGALNDEIRTAVATFFATHQAWIAQILRRGAARGEVVLREAPEETARLAFAALQGAVLVSRAAGRPQEVADVVASILNNVRRPAGPAA